jgi:hypothetical protein
LLNAINQNKTHSKHVFPSTADYAHAGGRDHVAYVEAGRPEWHVFCHHQHCGVDWKPIGGALMKACDGRFWGLHVFAGLTLGWGTILILATRTALVGMKLKVKV